MMAYRAILTGIICIAVGVIGYTGATPDPETGKVSPTALIPAGIGGVLALLGMLALNDGLRKHAMHLAAMVALFGLLGGFMPLIRQQSKGVPFDPLAPAARNGLIMSVACLIFLVQCIQSFRAARKAREASAVPTPPAGA